MACRPGCCRAGVTTSAATRSGAASDIGFTPARRPGSGIAARPADDQSPVSIGTPTREPYSVHDPANSSGDLTSTRFCSPMAAALLPAAVIVALLGALLAGPQQALRRPDSRIDNLRWAAVVLAAHELPGDAVLHPPASRRVVGSSYPVPSFRPLHVGRARPPGARGTVAPT